MNSAASVAGSTAAAPSVPAQEKKAFKIVDPGSGAEIPSTSSASGMRIGAKAFVPSSTEATEESSALAEVRSQWERKTMKIVDPRSGATVAGPSLSGMRVDAREFVPQESAPGFFEGLKDGDFKPASEHKKVFEILDPNSGVALDTSKKA